MRIRARNVHGDFGARVVILQKWIKSFNQERLDSSCSIREFGLDTKNSAQIDSFTDQVVCSVHLRSRAGNPEREAGKIGYAIFQDYVTLQIGKHALRIFALFSLRSLAQFVDSLLRVRIGKTSAVDAEVGLHLH